MKPLTGVDSNPTSPTSRPSPSIAISTPTPSDLYQPAGFVEAPPPVPSRETPLGQNPQPAVQYNMHRVARSVPTSLIRALINYRAHPLSWPSSFENSVAALMSSIPKPIASIKNTTDAEVCTQSAHPYLILLPLLKGYTMGALRFPMSSKAPD